MSILFPRIRKGTLASESSLNSASSSFRDSSKRGLSFESTKYTMPSTCLGQKIHRRNKKKELYGTESHRLPIFFGGEDIGKQGKEFERTKNDLNQVKGTFA